MIIIVFAWVLAVYMLIVGVTIKVSDVYVEKYKDQNITLDIHLGPKDNIALKRPQFNYSRLPSYTQWKFDAPRGYNVKISCKATPEMCDIDDVMVSRSGHPGLLDAELMCGDKHRSLYASVSTGQKLTLGITVKKNTYYRLLCNVVANPERATYCTCGYSLPKANSINRGVEAKAREFPMVAAIFAGTTLACAGAVIDARHVLTTATCLRPRADSHLTLQLAMLDNGNNGIIDSKRSANISHVIFHQRSSDPNYNVALLRTEQLIQFNQDVAPVCLPFKFASTDFQGANVTQLLYHDRTKLRKIIGEVVCSEECGSPENSHTNQECIIFYVSSAYVNVESSTGQGIPYRNFAPGGPVLYTDPTTGLYYLHSLVSKAEYDIEPRSSRGASKPVQYIKIAPLLDWIMNSTRDDCYDCLCKI